MAINAGTVAAALTLDTGQFEGALKQSRSLMETFGSSGATLQDKLQAVGDTMKGVGTAMTFGLTTTLTAAGTAATKAFASFDDAMRQVRATMNASEEDTERLTAAAKKYGAETSFSSNQAAEALNYLALAGYDADKAIEALPKVLQLAQAGGLDLAYASDLVTDSMSALGLEMNQLSAFSDQMAKTSQKSNTNVSQLGQAILTVGGTAKLLKGGTVELNTQLGILADNGIKSAEGGTHLRNVILSLTSPTDEAAKLMKALGVECFDAEGSLRSLDDIFQDLNTSMAEMTDAEKQNVLSNLFNKTDLAAVQALLAGCGDRYRELSGYISDSAGAAQQMAATMEGGIGGSFRELGSAAEAVAIEFGEALAPNVRSVTECVTDLASWVANLSDGTLRTITGIAGVVAAAGPVLAIGGKIISGLGTIKAGALAIGTAMTGPAGWITLGVAGLTMLIKYLSRSRESLTDVQAALKNGDVGTIDDFNVGADSFTQEISVDVEIKKDYAGEASTLYSDIYTWLTDGMPDTAQQKKDVSAKVQAYYDELISEVNLTESETQANLKAQFDKGFIDYDAYLSRTAEVSASAQASRDELSALCDEALLFLGNYSGAPASVVQEAYGEIDALEARTDELLEKIGLANTEMSEAGNRAISLTKAGATGDAQTYGMAFEATSQQYESNRAAIEADAAAAIEEIDAVWEDAYEDARSRRDEAGMEYANAHRQALAAEVEAGKKNDLMAMERAYVMDIQEMFAGIAKAYPEEAAILEDLMRSTNLGEEARNLLIQAFDGAALSPDMLSEDLKTEIDLSDIITWAEGDEEMLSEGIRNALTGVVQTAGDIDYTKALSSLSGTELGGVVSAMLERGYLEGVESVDLSTPAGILQLLTGELVDGANMRLAEGMRTASDDVQTSASMFTAAAVQSIQTGAKDIWLPAQYMGESALLAASKGGLNSASGALLGQSIATGTASGINSGRSRVINAATSMAKAAITAARAALGINSPSRVAREMGAFFGKGFELGIDDSVFSVKSAMRRLTDTSGLMQNNSSAGVRVVQGGAGVQYNISVNGATIRSEDEARDLLQTATKYTTQIQRGYGN